MEIKKNSVVVERRFRDEDMNTKGFVKRVRGSEILVHFFTPQSPAWVKAEDFRLANYNEVCQLLLRLSER